MYMIEKVIGHTFEYYKKHKVLKIVVDLAEVRVPPLGPRATAAAEADAPEGGAAAVGAHPPPHAPPCSSTCHRNPTSPIRKMFTAIFGMCRYI